MKETKTRDLKKRIGKSCLVKTASEDFSEEMTAAYFLFSSKEPPLIHLPLIGKHSDVFNMYIFVGIFILAKCMLCLVYRYHLHLDHVLYKISFWLFSLITVFFRFIHVGILYLHVIHYFLTTAQYSTLWICYILSNYSSDGLPDCLQFPVTTDKSAASSHLAPYRESCVRMSAEYIPKSRTVGL